MSGAGIVTAVVFVLTCLPLGWAHATTCRTTAQKIFVWLATAVIGAVTVVTGQWLHGIVLGLSRAGATGDRSFLLDVSIAALLAISLCAPIGLLAARLLRKRRA